MWTNLQDSKQQQSSEQCVQLHALCSTSGKESEGENGSVSYEKPEAPGEECRRRTGALSALGKGTWYLADDGERLFIMDAFVCFKALCTKN